MCGLAGVVGPSGRASADAVEAMARRLGHRGPDAFGSWRQGFASGGEEFEVALGHARLSILDLSSAGSQPMSSADGSVTVAYNGEVYNFRELRDSLAARGHSFVTECDTETLIAAYREWGHDALQRLVGMFAFAIWDSSRQRLVLVRDRLGIKPLYYRFSDGVLSFGSELTALRAHPGFHGEIDPLALGLFLRHGYVPGPQTIYRGTCRLMPGELLVWERGAIRTETWWSLAGAAAPEPAGGFDGFVDELERTLARAVEDRLLADVPLGAFLSGGVDSSTVVSLMKECAGDVRTFSIGFREPAWDEAPHARRIADHLKTDHTELYVDAEQAREVAREIPDLYDEPFADPSAIPTVLLSRLTRRHVTVSLSGDGGDELFGGYWQYEKMKRLLPLYALPGPLRSALAATAGLLPAGALRNGLLHLGAPDHAHLAYAFTCGVPQAAIADVCGEVGSERNPVFFEAFREAPVAGPVRRAMVADARVYLADDILTKVDRASMSVGLEARVPILDHRVVALALSAPLEVLWHGGRTKAPLRALLERRVPAALIDRPKQGFGIPIGTLLHDELIAWKARYLQPERLRSEGNLRAEGVAPMLASARRQGGPEGETTQLWRLLCFQRWFARHHGGEPCE